MLRERLIFVAMVAVPVATLTYFAVAFGFNTAFFVWLGGFVALGLALAALVRWHARNVAYRCGHCQRVFTISPFVDFTSPHCPGRKHLHCPGCGRRSWCQEVRLEA